MRRVVIGALIFAAACAGLTPHESPAGIVNISGPRLQVNNSNQYVWYPALDLSTIPFHVAAGAYGIQVPIEAPAAPVITRTANAANATELKTEMGTPGTRVTVTANIVGGLVDPVAATDIEVIIPNGILLDEVVFGGTGNFGTNATAWTRVRFTKASGDSIGGQIQQFRLIGASATDIVLDGLQISGNGEPAIYPGTTAPLTRFAVVNNQINTSTACFGYGAIQMVVAGNSCNHNAVDGSGPLSSWGFRQGGGDSDSLGPYVYYQNDIRGINYFQLRFHNDGGISGSTPMYVWVSENILLDRTAGAMIGAGDLPGTTGDPDISAMWYIGNFMYVNGSLSQTGLRSDLTNPITNYWRITGNDVHGVASGLSTWGASDSVNSGNTYTSDPGSDPAWGGAGNPTGINYNP